MQLVTGLNVYDKTIDASVVTIGNFDGVHQGHAEIFSHLKNTSVARSLPSVVVTFEPHPLKILAPDSAPLMITTFEQKAELIEKFGIDYLVVVPFTSELSQFSASDFVINILCSSLGMRHIIIGHDYAFGKGREGNFQTLELLGEMHGFTLEDIPPIGEEATVFSSSLVRFAVSGGDVVSAARILGRYYELSGTVIHGRKIGQSIGFPTANISSNNELIPADGVYAVMVKVGRRFVKGACNIGCNPTVGGKKQTIEVFLLDFSDQIYNQEVSIHFVQQLRKVQKFTEISALKSAINNDVENARFILNNLDFKFL
jgi:riboflavin kinase/FMN adenylyltransferase